VLLATFTILLRLDAGKLTRGLLLLILPVYMIFGAAIGIQLYEAFAR
jgi:hypothetical protein